MSPYSRTFATLACLIIVIVVSPLHNVVAQSADKNVQQIVTRINNAQSTLKMRSRMLDEGEGVSVDAYEEQGHYRKISVKALNEVGMTLSTFYYANDHLIRAQVISVGYKGYPNPSLTLKTPHDAPAGVIGPTDKILYNVIYDFSGDHLQRINILSDKDHNFRSDYHQAVKELSKSDTCEQEVCKQLETNVRTESEKFVLLMNTEPLTDDDGDWECVHGADDRCTSFVKHL